MHIIDHNDNFNIILMYLLIYSGIKKKAGVEETIQKREIKSSNYVKFIL
mgnify:CR=1 FL=1